MFFFLISIFFHTHTQFVSYENRIYSNLNSLRDLRNKHEVQIGSAVDQATESVQNVKNEATSIIQSTDNSHQTTKKLSEESDQVLERMKKLKDQLSKLNNTTIIWLLI